MNKLIACISLMVSVCFSACNKETADIRIAVTNITLDTENFALKLGDTRKVLATVIPKNATDSNLVWSSDDEAIATVNPNTGVVTGRGLGQTTIWAIAASDRSSKSQCTVTILATNPYSVGDLYPNAVTPQGLIFWIAPTNPASGKIVSLDETRKVWSNNETTTATLDSNDGQVNLDIIKTFENWQTDYPAFAWCAAKGDGWYLPALNELLTLYEAHEEVLQKVIEQNKDIPFSSSDYWTSTERRLNPKTTSVTVTFRRMSENESWASKNGICYVRAIKAF